MMQASSSPHERSAHTINALISLLSDRDRRVARQIHQRLMDVGHEALPLLRHAQHECGDPLLAQRLHSVIADLAQADIERQWATLLTSSQRDTDLETGAFLIAQAGDPHSEMAPWRQRLHDMADELTRLTDPSHTPRQHVLTINDYLFQTLGFRGNAREYDDPRNSFLHCVLDRRMGIPISLSVVYLLMSQRLNVPVVGIGMPGHFLVGLQTEPLFIDCFNRGRLLTEHDCARLVQHSGVAFDRRDLAPCSHNRILARMLRNLVALAERRHETADRQRWNRLLTLLERGEPSSHGH